MKLKYKVSLIEGNNGGHTYIIDDSMDNLLTGVTSILNIRHKEFLKPWAAKEAVKFFGYEDEGLAGEMIEKIKTLDVKSFIALLHEAKNSHARKSDKAKDSGKIAHDLIEEYIKTGKEVLIKVLELEDKEARNAFKVFLKWEKERKPKWIVSELAVGSEKNLFGGTLDALVEIDGVLALMDFKTSSQIGEEAFLQTAAYQFCLDEMLEKDEPRPVKRIILRIPKDGKDCEELEVPTPYDFDIQTFLHLREVYRWELNMKNNVKKEDPLKVVRRKTINKLK